MNSRKATLMKPLHGERVGAQGARQRAAEQGDERAEDRQRIRTHSSIEPSWFPQTPEIL